MNKSPMAKFRVVCWLALLAVLALSACGWGDPAESELDGGTLRQAIPNDLVTLDPSKLIEASVSQAVLYNVYDHLVEFDENLRPIPGLAESWDTEDWQTWSFNIRRGVYFHDDPAFPDGKGRELNAEDVVYSFLRVLDQQGGSAGSWILSDVVAGGEQFASGELKELDSIRAPDPWTVEIELRRPYKHFIHRLYAPFLGIVAREVVQHHGDQFGLNPVGSGPFKVASIQPAVEVRLSRHPKYWKTDQSGRQLPYLDQLIFRILRDPSIAFLEFENGNLDVIDLPVTLAKRVVDAEGNPLSAYKDFRFKSIVALETQFYAFNMQEPPFKGNQKLRQALNYAVNKEEIARFVLGGSGIPARGVLPPPLINYSQPGYPYEPAKARRLLEEAGHPEGRGLPELSLLIDADEVREAVAAAVQAQLADIGVRMRIEKTQFPTLLEQAVKGERNFFRMWWEIPYPDPGAFFFQFLSSLWPPVGYNFGRYASSEVDRLYEEATVATEETVQNDLWEELDRIISADAPWIFLYHSRKTKLLQPTIADFPYSSIQIQKLDRTRMIRE